MSTITRGISALPKSILPIGGAANRILGLAINRTVVDERRWGALSSSSAQQVPAILVGSGTALGVRKGAGGAGINMGAGVGGTRIISSAGVTKGAGSRELAISGGTLSFYDQLRIV